MTVRRPGRRAYLLIAGFSSLLILLPFLFWYYTWFGRPLSDTQLDACFAEASKPRRAQHALVQLDQRLSRGQPVARWYPEVLRQASSPSLELRETAAWFMGEDRTYPPFHEALLGLIHDPEPAVRRNAALSLAAFDDGAARPELVAMLRAFTITAPVAGTVKYRLKLGDYVNPGTLVARLGEAEVRSPVPGEVRDLESQNGATVKPGDSVVTLAADPQHVFQALRALYLVGQQPDLEEVRRFTRPAAGMPDTVTRQASLTAAAIASRLRN
jgi:biotin carboxyl carrier protein